MVSGLKGNTYLHNCAELGLKSLEERRKDQDMNLVYKFLTERTGTDMFQRTVTDQRATTRQAAGEHGLGVQYAKTDPRKYSFAMQSVEPWNRLP